MTDILIIGAGPAGLTAAIYARRAGRTATVFDGALYGGQAAITPVVENYPGIPEISGPEFSMRLLEQAERLGAEIRYERVERVVLEGGVKAAVTSSGRTEGARPYPRQRGEAAKARRVWRGTADRAGRILLRDL